MSAKLKCTYSPSFLSGRLSKSSDKYSSHRFIAMSEISRDGMTVSIEINKQFELCALIS